MDLSDWNDKYLRTPDLVGQTQPALFALYGMLRRIRECIPSLENQIVYIEGNHELRMEKAIAKNLACACDIRAVNEFDLPPAMSIPHLLALHTLGIEYRDGYPSNALWLNDGVRLSHGDVVRGPLDSVKAIVQGSDVTEIVGHIHRVEWMSRTLHHRNRIRTITAFSPGCTCWIDGRVPGSKGQQAPDAAHPGAERPSGGMSAAVVYYEPGGERYEIRPITFGEGGRSAMFNGHVYRTTVGEDGPPHNTTQEGYECLEAHA
jgi:hypothetical protein